MQRNVFRGLAGGVLLGLGLWGPAQALPTTHIDFDTVPAGSAADLAAPAWIRFSNAWLIEDLDAFGDPVPGSEKWQPDPSAPAVTADDPDAFGYGPAPSGSNALDARWQPVLMSFDHAVDLAGFSFILDNSVFGDLAPASLLFLGTDKSILAELTLDQTAPGFSASLAAPLAGVREILLPAGAFYDALAVRSVPAAGSAVLLASGLALLTLIGRRNGPGGWA